jgi:hypothetical protein
MEGITPHIPNFHNSISLILNRIAFSPAAAKKIFD